MTNSSDKPRRIRVERNIYRRPTGVLEVGFKDAAGMHPRLMPGATLLLDRHYTSLMPYRKGEFNMYAVLKNDTCAIRYVEVAGNHLILRPHNPVCPIEVITIPENKSASDYLIGRICQLGLEA